MQLPVELLTGQACCCSAAATNRSHAQAHQFLDKPAFISCQGTPQLRHTRPQRTTQRVATAQASHQCARSYMQQSLAGTAVLPQVILMLRGLDCCLGSREQLLGYRAIRVARGWIVQDGLCCLCLQLGIGVFAGQRLRDVAHRPERHLAGHLPHLHPLGHLPGVEDFLQPLLLQLGDPTGDVRTTAVVHDQRAVGNA
ncbi:hypothetical protein B1992_15025 [Pseudoxanthomonas broegbernensis]|uniref:Uncharacterized protein n=1 Tax=Pseudoxanthomonas broegbernensis TaxID=83619 RepID=A0A7V8K5M9_9GAMM|nr:hypothetical protein B1992_15025 [Pseudoxanthomonas broegbernensis]